MEVILTTTGRRTGEPRPVKLYAWPDGDTLVLVGSSGGGPRDPDWVGNLRAEPRATLQRGRRAPTEAVIAREIDGPDRDRLWTLVCEAFPYYERYQRNTDRRIPLFVLVTAEPPAP